MLRAAAALCARGAEHSLQGIVSPSIARQTRHMSKDLDELAERYVALWNEPDPEVRRDLIRGLWAADGAQILVDPPKEVRDAAEQLSFPVPPLEVHGYEALEARVTRAYEMFIAPGEYVFEAQGEASQLLGNVVGITWGMVSRDNRQVAGSGLDVLALDSDGRIRADYQFIGP
jgi:hypothetical protein